MSQPAAQGGIAVERGQFTEQLAGGGEQNSMTVDHRLMCEIAGQGGFTDAVWANQHGVGCVLEEVEAHQRLEGSPIDRRGPAPIEVAQGFEAADMGALKAALEAAAGASSSSQPMRASGQPSAAAS